MNPVTAQILWNRLLALVEEQAQVLMRTAFSTTVREAGDLSAGLFDPRGRMLAQAITGTPGHVNAMAASVGSFLNAFPVESLAEGDVLVTNDPWLGTGHLNDFTVVTPVFFDEKLVALFAATSHIADVGGLGFGSDARQVYEEGLCIPIMKLQDRGNLNQTLMAMIRGNVRAPDTAIGDLHSLMACNQHAGCSLRALIAEFNLRNLDDIAEHILDSSYQAMQSQINALPAGMDQPWRYSMTVDGDGEKPVELSCSLHTQSGELLIDFNGSSAPSTQGINVPLTYTQAYASFGARCVIGNDIPNNHGSLRAIKVSAPRDSILNAQHPAPVSARHVIGQMLPDVVLGALRSALGDRIPAEGASCLFGPVFSGGKDYVENSDSPGFVTNGFYTGGTGARANSAGLSCTAFPSGVRGTPVEITESTVPMLVLRKELRENSGGRGQQVGGMGQVIEFCHAKGEAFWVSKMFDRLQHPARGVNGAENGAATRVRASRTTLLNQSSPSDEPLELGGMGKSLIPAGYSLLLETAGGGGYGEPKPDDADR